MPELEKEINNKFIKLNQLSHDLLQKCKSNNITINENDNNTIDVICNKEKLFMAEYEILGSYDVSNGIFIWGWKMIDRENKHKTKSLKKYYKNIHNYVVNNKYSDIKYLERIHYYLSNDIFYLENDHLDIIIKFCCATLNSIDVIHYNDKLYMITGIIQT